jgi:tripartite-type tricarboxylate transporter receptor subunit TctC
MKKVISIMLMVMLVTMLFAGCAKKEEPKPAEAAKTETTTETKKEEPAKEAEPTPEVVESNYPERAINNIVPFGAGGGTDLWNRTLSAAMEETLGTKILVNNMPGGGPGGTGQAYVWDTPHDGYTILGTSETPLLVPIMTGMPQTTKDFEYFIAGGSPGLLCVNKDSGITSIDDLIAKTAAEPDKYKVASTNGGLWFILANLFGKYADVKLGNVTYDGSRPAITACVSGEVAAVTASAGEVADFIKSGDLIPIVAIQTNDFDFPGFGTIPAVTKTLPALEKFLPLNQFIGFMVPADTPADAIEKLQEAFAVAMASDEIKAFAEAQYAVFYNLTGEEARAYCAKAQSTMSWILHEMGLSEFSPEEFGIPKP